MILASAGDEQRKDPKSEAKTVSGESCSSSDGKERHNTKNEPVKNPHAGNKATRWSSTGFLQGKFLMDKPKTLELVEHLRTTEGFHESSRSEKLEDCGCRMLLPDEFAKLKKPTLFFCQMADLCPVCGRRRQIRRAKSKSGDIATLLKVNPYLRVYVVTIAAGVGKDCAAMSKQLRQLVRKLLEQRTSLRRKGRGKRSASSELKKVAGGVFIVEHARTGGMKAAGKGMAAIRNRQWLPHAHGLLLVEGTLDVARFEAAVGEIFENLVGRVGHSRLEIKLENLRALKHVSPDAAIPETLLSVVEEQCKRFISYASKADELGAADRWKLFTELRPLKEDGSRSRPPHSCIAFGIMRGVRREGEANLHGPLESPTSAEGNSLRWNRRTGRLDAA